MNKDILAKIKITECIESKSKIIDLKYIGLLYLPDFEKLTKTNLYNFKIDTLNCEYNKLIELPNNLPSIKELKCNYNRLEELPNVLPKELKKIFCNHNKLTELSENLPNTLQKIDCSYNKIQKLPNKLPDKLFRLNCSYNLITYIPDNLPKNLTMDIRGNPICWIPIKVQVNNYIIADNMEFLCKMGAIIYIQRSIRFKLFYIKLKKMVILNRLYNEYGYEKNISNLISKYL